MRLGRDSSVGVDAGVCSDFDRYRDLFRHFFLPSFDDVHCFSPCADSAAAAAMVVGIRSIMRIVPELDALVPWVLLGEKLFVYARESNFL